MFKEKLRKAIAHYGKTKDLRPVCRILREMIEYVKNNNFGLEFRFTDALPEIVTMLSSLNLGNRVENR